MPHDLFIQTRGLVCVLPPWVIISLESINSVSTEDAGRPTACRIAMGLCDNRLINDSFKFIFLYSR